MKATRASFGDALVALGGEFQNVVALDADLSKSTKSEAFGKKYPERFFQMGIQEANMIGAAAGLALSGKIPFLCSFACFLTGRFDIIRVSVGYSNANVRLVGTHAGIGIGEDGYSQMGLEDIACMRTLPNMAVLQPADDIETKA
ncbi:MAG TPA: transketolase family protein, partial [Bdellovibrionales bacterium]|nr:transketolase family protein [Bdellovibrionales bacterium]